MLGFNVFRLGLRPATLLAGLALAFALPADAIARQPGATAPKTLVLEDYFSRPATATGTFKNTLDGTVRGIKVRFRGQWNARTRLLTLTEDIAYSDGEKDRKVWRLQKTGPGTYTGTRADVVGVAVGTTDARGRVNLRYRAVVGTRTLSFDDVLALQPDGSVLNTATVSYLFIHVGDVELRFRRGR